MSFRAVWRVWSDAGCRSSAGIAQLRALAAMETCMHRVHASGRPGFCALRPQSGRRYVGAAAGKNNQKNRGLYFEYEAVDPEAAKLVPREAEKQKTEFGWAQQARQAARRHRERRDSFDQPQGAGQQRRGDRRNRRQQDAGNQASGSSQQQQQRQQGVQQAAAPATTPDLPPSTAPPAAAGDGQAAAAPGKAVVSQPAAASTTSADVTAANSSSSSSSSSANAAARPGDAGASQRAAAAAPGGDIRSRRLQLLQRMRGAAGAAPAAAAAAAVGAGVSGAAVSMASSPPSQNQQGDTSAPVSASSEATAAGSAAAAAPADVPLGLPLASFQQLPSELQELLNTLSQADKDMTQLELPQSLSLPTGLDQGEDAGELEGDQAEMLAALQSWFVDELKSAGAASGVADEEEAESASASDAGAGFEAGSGGSLNDALRREEEAERELKGWMDEVLQGDGKLDRLSMLVSESMTQAGFDGNTPPEEFEAGLAAMLREATQNIAEFQSLSLDLTPGFTGRSSSGTSGGSVGGDASNGSAAKAGPAAGMSDAALLEVLRRSDPELYRVLQDDDGEEGDIDELLALTGAGGDEVNERELEEFLRSLGGAAGGGAEDEEAFLNALEGEGEDEGSIGDLFDAIDEDEELDSDDKMRMTHELQGIFNMAAQAAGSDDASAAKGTGKKSKAPAAAAKAEAEAVDRGATTTGGVKGGPDQVPPLLAKPVRRG